MLPGRTGCLFVLAGLLLTVVDAADWSPLGPAGTQVHALAMDPSDSLRLYAATTTGIFRTTDGGVQWD